MRVCDHIGSIVFENDIATVSEVYDQLSTGKLSFSRRKKEGVLYLEADGAALNTRHKHIMILVNRTYSAIIHLLWMQSNRRLL